MSSLLRKLHIETFVLSLRNSIATAPKLDGYVATLIDDHTLEVEVSKEQNLNDIFSRLSALGIEVLSMRNKVNRLEEIFMRLVDKSAQVPSGETRSAAAPSDAAAARVQGGRS
jgi:ABC-2 type transport system ATP-binding protein